MRIFTTVFCFFCVVGICLCSIEHGTSSLSTDPMGDKDSFAELTERQIARWARSLRENYMSKTKALKALTSTINIDIKLVGFNGEGNGRVSVSEADLRKYLDVLKWDPHRYVLSGKPHHLHVERQFYTTVSKLGKEIHDQVFRAIEVAIPQELGGKPEKELAQVPYRVVDSILSRIEKHDDMYTIIILNMTPQSKSYGYSYSKDGALGECLGTSYASTERMLWVDLTAGPVSYGPSYSGDGLVGPHTFPSLTRYTNDQQHKAFLADLVAMVYSAAKHLVAPPLNHMPHPFAANYELELFYIGSKEGGMMKEWKSVQEELERIVGGQSLLVGKQQLFFKQNQRSKYDCPFCVNALARATKAYSVAYRAVHGYSSREYVDSEELYAHLSDFWPAIEGQSGEVLEQEEERGERRIIPVFVFEVNHANMLLLDRTHQAVAFPDMVLAVSSPSQFAYTGFSCNKESVAATDDLRRPLVAAILQSVWNVAPTHLTWSPAHNASVEDYRWSVGQTPFGPLSAVSSLSFAQFDAARRNTIEAVLNQTVGKTLEVLEAVKEFGGEEVVLLTGRLQNYNARFNYLMHKLDRGLQALAVFQWDAALYYFRSAHHDAAALRTLAQDGAGELHSSLSCFTDPPIMTWWYVMFPVGGVLTYVTVRRKSLFKSKSKRF